MTLSLTPEQERQLSVLEQKLRRYCLDHAQHQLLRSMIEHDAQRSEHPRLTLLVLLHDVVARMEQGTLVFDPSKPTTAAMLAAHQRPGPNRAQRRSKVKQRLTKSKPSRA